MKEKIKLTSHSILAILIFNLIIQNYSFGQQIELHKNDLYAIAIWAIAKESLMDNTLKLADTLYFITPIGIKCNSPAIIENTPITFLSPGDLPMPNGNYFIFELNPLYFDGEGLRINYILTQVVIMENTETWICCDGCSSGGQVTFEYDCANGDYFQNQIYFYNCF